MTDDRDFVQSLARGLAVLRTFSDGRSDLTLAEIADAAGISRPSARRLLLTYERLGYVRCADHRYSVTPRVLALAQAYLSSSNLVELSEPYMQIVAERTHESCSLGTLDGSDVLYVARVPTRRIMSIVLSVGTRLPAYATSMGRVLLASLPKPELESVLAATEFAPLTTRTITSASQLHEALTEVRAQGWALVDQELEEGLRSVSAPVIDASGRVVAAVNSSCHTSRVDLQTMRKQILPVVLEAAAGISSTLGHQASLSPPVTVSDRAPAAVPASA